MKVVQLVSTGHKKWDLLPQPMLDVGLHQLGGSQCWMLFFFAIFWLRFFQDLFFMKMAEISAQDSHPRRV